jgi:hypothetical protein
MAEKKSRRAKPRDKLTPDEIARIVKAVALPPLPPAVAAAIKIAAPPPTAAAAFKATAPPPAARTVERPELDRRILSRDPVLMELRAIRKVIKDAGPTPASTPTAATAPPAPLPAATEPAATAPTATELLPPPRPPPESRQPGNSGRPAGLTTIQHMIIDIIEKARGKGLRDVLVTTLHLKIEEEWPAEVKRRKLPKPYPPAPKYETVRRTLRVVEAANPQK